MKEFILACIFALVIVLIVIPIYLVILVCPKITWNNIKKMYYILWEKENE